MNLKSPFSRRALIPAAACIAALVATRLPVARGAAKAVIGRTKAAPPTVSAKAFVDRALTKARAIPIENIEALTPFFDSLYRHQVGELAGPTRVLHYGDSHTAADFFTGELRNLLQAEFGNGGSGFSMPGKPWPSYRRADVRSGSSEGWRASGLVGRKSDGIDGMGGLSMMTSAPRETLFIDTEAASFELYYRRQPDGGSVRLLDNGKPVATVKTEGPLGEGYSATATDGSQTHHRLELQTEDAKSVRLFGWVAENPSGITYEPLGLNGAQISTMLRWDTETLSDNLQHRRPDLIVLWFGTNEAGANLSQARYEVQYSATLERLHAVAPEVPILILSPLDRATRVGAAWRTMASMMAVVEGQRNAARAAGCAFLDLRAMMGGAGSMPQWVQAGLAQPDRAHFNSAGYKRLARVVFDTLTAEYDRYVSRRSATGQEDEPGR